MGNDFLFFFYVRLIRRKLHPEKLRLFNGLSTGFCIKNNVNSDSSFKRGIRTNSVTVPIDLGHTNSVFGGCRGERVEDIGKLHQLCKYNSEITYVFSKIHEKHQ